MLTSWALLQRWTELVIGEEGSQAEVLVSVVFLGGCGGGVGSYSGDSNTQPENTDTIECNCPK